MGMGFLKKTWTRSQQIRLFMWLPRVREALSIGDPFDPSAVLDDYVIEKEIGEGGFGKVFKAAHKVTGEVVAMKYIDISEALTQADQMDDIYRETKALENLDHRNIIKLIKSVIQKKNIIMIMECCGGGELYEYVINYGNLEEYDAREIFT
jgi:serine/threonine protein kinase